MEIKKLEYLSLNILSNILARHSMGAHALNSKTRETISEFEASQAYMVSSRIARVNAKRWGGNTQSPKKTNKNVNVL